PHAGFSAGAPWLPVNENYRQINAADQEEDPGSVLQHYRRLIALRKREPALVYGDFRPLSPEPGPYVYARTLGDTRLIVALNWSGEPVTLPVGDWFDPRSATLLLANGAPPDLDAGGAGTLTLGPWRACIYRTGP
ncbi:MAG TPA: DUF3459 domain-containing protein, partial [Polyangiaceae bacterium]|nr:DUF3459 domain-containing protein [Polyangiaceae bacterium]